MARDTVSGEARRTEHWQLRLLPVMVVMLLVAAGVFWASIRNIEKVNDEITRIPALELDRVLEPAGANASAEARELLRWKTLAKMEAQVIDRRYHQAAVLLLARTWIVYMGFVTGMLLCLIGATFILGKLSEERTEGSGNGGGIEFKFSTASPGLVLAFIGASIVISSG